MAADKSKELHGVRLPVVGLPCCVKTIGDLRYQAVGEKYITAVRDMAGAMPILIPALIEPLDPPGVLALVDGLLITGSPSNVAPDHYGGPPPRDGAARLDRQRDALTMPLITAAIERAVPVLALCRGLQELNVALGGTLEQHVHEVAGRLDHREMLGAAEETRYGPAHPVEVVEGGLLDRLLGERRFLVNSLHSQAIDRLAPGLSVEARAPDGIVEAVSMPEAPGFLLALQWHPEWRGAENPISQRIFHAFGEALRGGVAGAA